MAFVAVLTFGRTAVADGESKAHPSAEKEFEGSSIVIVGKVTSARDVLEAGGFIKGTFYSIRVAEVLKGSPPKTLELYSENSSGRFPMAVGVSYLIFAYESVFEGIDGKRLAIDSSGNSGTPKGAKKALATARRLKNTKAQQDAAANRRYAFSL